ncbi:hypothetical protein VTK26DRAFT_2489 [Humicola hyalothermophila]
MCHGSCFPFVFSSITSFIRPANGALIGARASTLMSCRAAYQPPSSAAVEPCSRCETVVPLRMPSFSVLLRQLFLCDWEHIVCFVAQTARLAVGANSPMHLSVRDKQIIGFGWSTADQQLQQSRPSVGPRFRHVSVGCAAGFQKTQTPKLASYPFQY